MVPNRCDSCGALNFHEDKTKYICTYCNTEVLKEPKEDIHNHTYIIKENKYRYTLLISFLFIAYLAYSYTQHLETEDTLDTLKTRIQQKTGAVKTRTRTNTWTVMSKSAIPTVYQNIMVNDVLQTVTFCYKERQGSFEISRDRFGEMSKPLAKKCTPNTQTTLQQADGTIKATSVKINGQTDIKLTKYDSNNNKIWERTFGSIHDDTLTHIVPGLDGHILLAGTSFTGVKHYRWLFQVYDNINQANLSTLTSPASFWKK